MSYLFKAIRHFAWLESDLRKTELSCPKCDSNYLMEQSRSENKNDEEHVSIVECPMCKIGLLLNEQPNNKLTYRTNFNNNYQKILGV